MFFFKGTKQSLQINNKTIFKNPSGYIDGNVN